MTGRRAGTLVLALGLAVLPATAIAQDEPTVGGWTGTWEEIYPCAPWFRYEYYGVAYFMHWNCGASDLVNVFNSTTGVTTEALLDAAANAAAAWRSEAPGLLYLTFAPSADERFSRIAFFTDANWTMWKLPPTAAACTRVATHDNGTVQHLYIWLHIIPTLWGWCTDCTAPGADCFAAPGMLDLPTILTHEFGHCWVLGDATNEACASDVMYGYLTATAGWVNRTPSDEDILSVNMLYSMPVEATASLYRVEATPDGVDLVWLLGRGGQSACVERCLPAGSWSVLETVAADGTGWLHFRDATVVPGTRYGYRLRLDGADGDLLAGETWVDVPLWVLTLGPITPNPSRDGAPRVRCVLPDATPASLDVVDVSGRLVGRTDVGALGRGVHTVQLGAGSPLAAGVYWLRLRQGTQALTTRAVIAR